MAYYGFKDFDRRIGRIEKRRRKLSGGYVHRVSRDGLVVVKPRASYRFPFKGIVLTLAGLFVLKAFLVFSLGETLYQDRVTKLSEGTSFEAIGAKVMTLDPVTEALHGVFRTAAKTVFG